MFDWLAANKEIIVSYIDVVLDWCAAHRDALIAVAALVSPLVAVGGTLISAVVSYRAVVTGPRIQREIAQQQFRLTNRQLDLQERTIALTEAQISANLVGIADQKWIEGFRDAIAQLDALINECGILLRVQHSGKASLPQQERLLELGNLAQALISKIVLMVGRLLPELRFVGKLRAWYKEEEV